MPLCSFTQTSEHGAHLLWHIDEPEEVLLRANRLSSRAQLVYQKITHPRKKREWLAARLALKGSLNRLGHEYTELHKDAWGRPYLANSSLHLSIAHCFPFAFAAVDRQHAIGVDIQLPSRQLQNVKEKFLNNQEMKATGSNLGKLCIYWCAKEAIYKAHGGKHLSLKQDISINAFSKQDRGVVLGAIGLQLFTIHYSFYGGHVLAWCREVIANNQHEATVK